MDGIQDRLAAAAALKESDTLEAERILRQLIVEAPHLREPYAALFETLIRRGSAQPALEIAEAALARDPSWTPMRSNRAFALYLIGDLSGVRDELVALRSLRRIQEGDLMLGLAHHALGEHPQAVDVLQGALALSAADEPGAQARAWVALMRLYRDIGYETAADDAANAAHRLYATKPVWVSSTISKLVNRRDHPSWETVRRKDGLARALAALPPGYGPNVPETYVLPEDRERLMRDALDGSSGPVWIAKAGDLFGGQGIWLTDDVAAIPPEFSGVVQQYIDRPFLLDGKKGHLRTYVLITSVDPLRAWFWRDGLVRFAPAEFVPGEGWLNRLDMHITNTAAHVGHPGIVIDPDPSVENRGSIWGLAAFLRQTAPDEAAAWAALEEVARGTLRAFAGTGLFSEMATGGRAFLPKLIGLDMLLDADYRPWLLEIQRVPGQTGPGPVNTVNARLFREVFEMTVAPIAGEGPMAAREAASEHARARKFSQI